LHCASKRSGSIRASRLAGIGCDAAAAAAGDRICDKTTDWALKKFIVWALEISK